MPEELKKNRNGTRKERNTICVVVARGGSTRLPGKNIKRLNGKPLLCYSIEAALQSKVFNEIWLSSDDEEILEAGREYSAVFIDKRPAELAGSDVKSLDVIFYLLEMLKKKGKQFNVVCMLQPTSPLRGASHIKGAMDMLNEPDTDFVVGVQHFTVPPRFELHCEGTGLVPVYEGYLTAITHTQSIRPSLHPARGLYIGRVDALFRQRHFYGERTKGYTLDKIAGLDINDRDDFKLVEAVARFREEL